FVVEHFRMRDANESGETRDLHRSQVGHDIDRVSDPGAVHGDLVSDAITGGAANGGGEVDGDGGEIGASEIINRAQVGPADGVEGEVLEVVQIEGDRGDVAGEAHAGTIGHELECFGNVGSVEDHGV